MEEAQNAHAAQQGAPAAAAAAPQVVDTTSPSLQSMSPQQLVDHLAVLLQQEELPERKLVDNIKLQFQRRKERLSSELTPAERETLEIHESRLEDLFTTFRERDRKRQEALEVLYAENKLKREALLERFAALFKDNEEGVDFAKLYASFTELREEWKTLGEVAPQDQAVLTKRFYELRDEFYDLKAVNDELRELDFKKNLEAKRQLIEELRQLDDIKDTIEAHHRLTSLIAQWHELGPVAKELRAELQAEYKTLTTAQHKRHQDFHDQKRASEEENLQAKVKLCEAVEALLEKGGFTTHSAWNKGVDQIKAWQAEWKQIGRAPRKDNELIWQRFRAGIDTFFLHRGEFVRRSHAEEHELLEKKRALIARAQELRERTDWDAAAAELRQLQEDWKALGPVSQRHSQRIWAEFREHFDYFFERRRKEGRPQRTTARGAAQEHLEAKRQILAELEAIRDGELPEKLSDLLAEYNTKWKAIGFVPQQHKEEINARYRELLDQLHGALRKNRSARRLHGYEDSLKQLEERGGSLQTERQRMQRQLDRLRSELETYEANLTRLSISSASGSSLLGELERKRTQLEEDIKLAEQKLALLKAEERQG